jgi:hypothetical protein
VEDLILTVGKFVYLNAVLANKNPVKVETFPERYTRECQDG